MLLVGEHQHLKMKNYTPEVRTEARILFDQNFNHINFDMLKKAIGEDQMFDYIARPSDKVLEASVKNNFTEKEWEKLSKNEKDEKIQEWYDESEHYPMWLTLFEAQDKFLSEKIENDSDGLYKLGIGVITATDWTNACLFIAGAGYDFYDAHFIPMFERWDWLDIKKVEKETEAKARQKMVDLQELKNSKESQIKRHARGLIEALNL